MKITFTETESSDQEFYAEALPEQELTFADTLAEVAPDVEILSIFINSRVSAEFLAAHPRLRLVASRSAATDHIDLAACRAQQVAVAVVPHYGEKTVAEHTFALLLAITRRLRESMLLPKAASFTYEATRSLELAGKTLGIIGMGRVGQRVATLAHAFEMQVLAYDVEARADIAQTLNFEFVSLDDLLAGSDIISLHASLSPATHHILNRDTLAKCRPGVIIINTARGRLIDTHALREALDSGQVGAAGLDVLEDERVMRQQAAGIIASEIIAHLHSDVAPNEARDPARLRALQNLMLGDALLARPNVVFTPHTAFNSEEAVERLQQGAVDNIVAFLAGRPVNLLT